MKKLLSIWNNSGLGYHRENEPNNIYLENGHKMLYSIESGCSIVDLYMSQASFSGVNYTVLLVDKNGDTQEYTVDAESYAKAYEIWKSSI